MGANSSKDKKKQNKDHQRQKMFKLGVSFGKDNSNLEAHVELGYRSKTQKKYDRLSRSEAEMKLRGGLGEDKESVAKHTEVTEIIEDE